MPNVISALRIAGSIGLLFCNVTGWPFWTLYALCGISDMVDGWLARKLHAETKAGAILDSVADLSFVACCAIRLLPHLSIPSWLWIWAGIIVVIKLLAVPTLFWTVIPVAVVAAVATFAAIQEGRVRGNGEPKISS